jgi:FkbM family methyltransferase
MMLPLQDILNKYNIHPKGIIVVGTHWAEEHDEFLKCGIERFVVSPSPLIKLFNVACGEEEGEMPMYVSHQNQGQSNSLLKPELHITQHPEVIFDDAEIVKVVPLDKLAIDKSQYDMLYMDVQGAEGMVLKGADEVLKNVKIIMTECNRGQTYAGNMEIAEMDIFMSDYGFYRVETFWPSVNWTWGDCVYIKQKTLTSEDLDML